MKTVTVISYDTNRRQYILHLTIVIYLNKSDSDFNKNKLQ